MHWQCSINVASYLEAHCCHDREMVLITVLTQSLLTLPKTMILWYRYSGALFMIAAIILACAEHIAMIVIGLVFQGVAVSSCHALALHI